MTIQLSKAADLLGMIGQDDAGEPRDAQRGVASERRARPDMGVRPVLPARRRRHRVHVQAPESESPIAFNVARTEVSSHYDTSPWRVNSFRRLTRTRE